MDPMALAGMIFTLIVLMLIGGFVLLFPLSRRMGLLMEQRLADRAARSGGDAELAQLREGLRAVQDELLRLSERQEFTESLVAERDPLLLKSRPAADRAAG
jgi:hypothetical protein